MKNRILSAVLAVVMVVSMSVLLAVSSHADATYTMTVGTVAVPAGETAYVDITLTAEGMDEGLHLRDWQVTVTADATISEADSTFYGEAETVYSFINEESKEVAATAAKGEAIATAAQLAEGYKLATIALTAEADTEVAIEVTVLTVEASDNVTRTNVAESVTTAAGAVTVDAITDTIAPIVDGSTISFVGTIVNSEEVLEAIDAIGLKIVFVGETTDGQKVNRTFEDCSQAKVYTTIAGVATLDEATASSQGAQLVEGDVFLTGATVSGVPAGTYTVTVAVVTDNVAGGARTYSVTVD